MRDYNGYSTESNSRPLEGIIGILNVSSLFLWSWQFLDEEESVEEIRGWAKCTGPHLRLTSSVWWKSLCVFKRGWLSCTYLYRWPIVQCFYLAGSIMAHRESRGWKLSVDMLVLLSPCLSPVTMGHTKVSCPRRQDSVFVAPFAYRKAQTGFCFKWHHQNGGTRIIGHCRIPEFWVPEFTSVSEDWCQTERQYPLLYLSCFSFVAFSWELTKESKLKTNMGDSNMA